MVTTARPPVQQRLPAHRTQNGCAALQRFPLLVLRPAPAPPQPLDPYDAGVLGAPYAVPRRDPLSVRIEPRRRNPGRLESKRDGADGALPLPGGGRGEGVGGARVDR